MNKLTREEIVSVLTMIGQNDAVCPKCQNPHLKLFEKSGVWQWSCKIGGCDSKDVRKKIDVRLSTPGYKPRHATAAEMASIGDGEPAKLSGSLTVDELAEVKQLPAEYLREVWKLADCVHTGVKAVAIPYSAALTQFRGSGKKNQLFPAGAKTELYGLDKLTGKNIENLFIVEGCSDCWTMHHAGFDVLGIPGLGSWKEEWTAQIRALKPAHVYLIQEPDDHNAPVEKWTFKKSDAWRGKITGHVRGVRLHRKDASEIWIDAMLESAAGLLEATPQDYFREVILKALPASVEKQAEKPAAKSEAEKPVWKLVLTSADQYKMERMTYLWPYRVPLGETCLFCGVPGAGKGTAVVDLISRISTGANFCDSESEFKTGKFSIVLAGEDSITKTVIPRLRAAGANLALVKFANMAKLQYQNPTKTERRISFETDITQLESAVRENSDVKLVVIDPLDSYIGMKNKNKDAEMRPLMDRLKEFAASLEIAVVIVLHLNKSSEKAAIDRVAGAGAIIQAPRSAWIFMRDAEDETKKIRLMVPLKNNNTSDDKACTLKFQIAEFSVPVEGEKPIESSKVEWIGKDENNRDADTVFESQRNAEPKDGKQAACAELIKQLLSGGARRSRELHLITEEKGFTPATFGRATVSLRCVKKQLSDGWYMWLPGQEAPIRGFNYDAGTDQVSPIEESLLRPTIAPESHN